jgi:hypothetical protein
VVDLPEVGHVEDGLLVGAKEVEKLLNTEEVEVGPLEVLIVKGKGEDGAEIVVGLRQDNLF